MGKVCNICNQEKDISCFYKDKKAKDKHSYSCKDCCSKRDKLWRENNILKEILRKIIQRCTNPNSNRYYCYGGRGIKCLIAEEELKQLWFRDKAYLMKKPSIDREDNDGNYEYGNCRFIELGENSAERNRRVCSKPVLQYDLEKNFIREWSSISEIERQLSFSKSHISKACKNKYKQSYGFIWRFKNGNTQ